MAAPLLLAGGAGRAGSTTRAGCAYFVPIDGSDDEPLTLAELEAKVWGEIERTERKGGGPADSREA